MDADRLLLARAGMLVKREARTPGVWALAFLFLGFGLLNVWPGTSNTTAVESLQSVDLGPLSFSSWIGVLVATMSIVLPIWVIERVPLDQKNHWFDPLHVAGWKRESYLVTQLAVIAGLGSAVFLLTMAVAGLASFLSGAPLPHDWVAKVTVAIPTFLAAAAGGLLLSVVGRERAVAMTVGVIGIAIPMAVSGYFVLKLDQYPSESLRFLISLHLPPMGHDPAPVWILHKVAYAAGALWLSLLLGERMMGRRA